MLMCFTCWLRVISAQGHFSSGPCLGPCPCYAVVTLCLALHYDSPDLFFPTCIPSLSSNLPHHCRLSGDQWAVNDPGRVLLLFTYCGTTSFIWGLAFNLSSQLTFPCGAALSCCSLTSRCHTIIQVHMDTSLCLYRDKTNDRAPEWKFFLTFVSIHQGQWKVSAPFWGGYGPYYQEKTVGKTVQYSEWM